jgi:hypothetical protein
MLLIPFSFNQHHHFLYKYSCHGFNKSVFNWTFVSYSTHGKTQLHKKIKIDLLIARSFMNVLDSIGLRLFAMSMLALQRMSLNF